MKPLYLILYFIYLNLHFSITETFNFLSETCLGSFSNRTKMGDVFAYTYHPKDVGTIVFFEHHTVRFPSSNKIVTLILVLKNENIQLAKVIYSDLNNDNIINDLYYHKNHDQWNRIDEETFENLFVKISNKLRTFNINKLSEKWYSCGEGLSDQKLCTIEDGYFVKKIIMGNTLIWENEFYYFVYAIGMTLKENLNNHRILVNIYCTIDDKNHIIEFEVDLTQTHIYLTKNAWGIPIKGSNQSISDSEEDKKSISENYHSTPHQGEGTRIPLDIKAIRNRLKGIKLVTEPQLSNDESYKIRNEIMLEISTFLYEPLPGVKVKLLKDRETIVWDSNDLTKIFFHARFFYIGESPILLNVNYLTETKSFFGTKTHKHDQYFIKSQEWRTLTKEKFNEELKTLSDSATLYQSNAPTSGNQCSLNTEESETEILDSSTTDVIPKDDGPRLKNVTLELIPSEIGNYRISGYLMDGLDTKYYEPTNGALVKYVKDGDKIIWNYDDKKRTLIHAKFCYKKDSKIFLAVFYSTMDGNKLVKKFDYFIKRDKWYHSTEEEFHKLLDLLINKVTMRARIINEKVSFEDHVKTLDIIKKGPKPGWFNSLLGKKQSITELKPFEYDVNEDGYEKFIVEVNMNTKFGIYTPKIGLALSRIKDGNKVVWFQETNGLGCTTLYMDFSGKDPLIHLIVDDPLDSHLYYKKIEGNWHVIDEEEYNQIRKMPTSQSERENFVRIDNSSKNNN